MKSARDAQIGLLGVRVHPRQHSAEQFKRFVASTDLPLIGCLRDTQNYVHLAAYGLSVFDLATQRVAADREQWAEIENWVPL